MHYTVQYQEYVDISYFAKLCRCYNIISLICYHIYMYAANYWTSDLAGKYFTYIWDFLKDIDN